MPNIAYFDIPADDIVRAKKFYSGLLGWEIQPSSVENAAATQYHEIVTGAPEPGTMHWGGLYKRQAGEPIHTFVKVDDIDAVLAKVERLGGEIVMPKWAIRGVGLVAMIRDSEGNGLGIWKPEP